MAVKPAKCFIVPRPESAYLFCTNVCLFLSASPFRFVDGLRLKLCVDKKNQLDVTFCILYFSSNSSSTCFGQPCAHHQELTTA